MDQQVADDGTRIIKLMGCEYRLAESEILSWLVCFGEVVSEITEEKFDDQGLGADLPPIGNGTYINVTPLPFSPVQFQYNCYFNRRN